MLQSCFEYSSSPKPATTWFLRSRMITLLNRFRDHHVAIPLVQITRHLRRSENGVNVLAIEREPLQPAVAAVRYHQQRRFSARINPQAVRAINLVVTFP